MATFTKCNSLTSLVLIGARENLDLSSDLRLDGSALNEVYTNLADLNGYSVTAISTVGSVGSTPGTITYTIGTHHMVVGQFVTITGTNSGLFNYSDAVVTSVTSTTFTITEMDMTPSSGNTGTVTARTGKTINVRWNPGGADDTPSIATNKGWTVVG